MERFDGKVVIITGAASGLGRAIAIAFASGGAAISSADIDSQGLQETLAMCREVSTAAVQITVVDLGRRSACAKLVANTVALHGGLDVLVNCAAILGSSRVTDVSEAVWNKLMAINLSAPFWLSQAAIPHLIARGGNIVNIASNAAFTGQPYMVPYAASKAAVVHMTKSMAVEYLKENIRINAVAPAGMYTNIARDGFPEDADPYLMGRIMGCRDGVQPEIVADLVIYVASDRASNIHGVCLQSDGGATA